MRNILFFGDSLTAGYGLRSPNIDSFPANIEQKLNVDKLPFKVVNAGLSGDTSAGGLNRIDYWLNQPIDIFVLELGINDIIRGIPPSLTLKNLQAIINKVKAKYPQVKIAIMGMQIPAFIHSTATKQFSEIFINLTDNNHISLVPFFLEGVAGNPGLNLPDRLHPNAHGYKVIANNVWPVIKNLIDQYSLHV